MPNMIVQEFVGLYIKKTNKHTMLGTFGLGLTFLAATRAGIELISMPNMTIQSWLGYKLRKQINTPCRVPLV